MIQVLIFTLLFNLATSFSIALTGNRSLISGNLEQNFLKVIFDWRFILAMVLAVASRFLFIIINNRLLKIPSLAPNSTTITVFITASSYIFIILVNYLLLQERITTQQLIGSAIIIGGIVVLSL